MKLFSIYDRNSGTLIAALDRANIIAIYRNSEPFIVDADGDHYEVTANGEARGLSKIRGLNAQSRSIKALRNRRRNRAAASY